MICHGGAGMSAQVAADGTIRLGFNPTTTAASATPPGPGQCGWLDRGWRSGEPPVLKSSGGLSAVHYLIDGMVGGGSFYVHVHNDNAGSMVVDHVGP